MGTSVLPTHPLCQPSGWPHSASAVPHPRIQAAGRAASFYIRDLSIHKCEYLQGSWKQLDIKERLCFILREIEAHGNCIWCSVSKSLVVT